MPILNPKVVRDEIDVERFNLVKRLEESDRVRVYLNLEPYKINTVIDAYELDGYIYVHQGFDEPSGYKTYYLRYLKNESTYVVHKLRKDF